MSKQFLHIYKRHHGLTIILQFDYLVHSILALSASHLDAIPGSSAAEQALQHRILAVKSLNEALSTPPKTQREHDARMAAALALAFQSSHLAGLTGLFEFLTMIRGVSLIAGEENPVFSVSNRSTPHPVHKRY